MAEQRPNCEHCGEHGENSLKIRQNCEKLKKLAEDQHEIDKMINGKDGLYIQMAVINQKLEAIKWPLYLIATAAIINIGQNLMSWVGGGG